MAWNAPQGGKTPQKSRPNGGVRPLFLAVVVLAAVAGVGVVVWMASGKPSAPVADEGKKDGKKPSTIAVAKHNPKAQMTGIDRWGVEYSSFSKTLCEAHAKAEGVSNTSFAKGDAVRLNYADETFDAVCSNYVYHNIPSRNRQEILMETLRVLKKGGTFAIHDIFSSLKYGDMQMFVQRLKDMGYADVKLVPTDNGLFMSRREATWLGLRGSAILVGKK